MAPLGVKTINTGNQMTSGYLNKDLSQPVTHMMVAKQDLPPNHGLPLPQPLQLGVSRTMTGKMMNQVALTFTALSNLVLNLDQLAPLSNARPAPPLLISLHQTRKSKTTMFQTSVRIKKSLLPSNTSPKLRLNSVSGILRDTPSQTMTSTTKYQTSVWMLI